MTSPCPAVTSHRHSLAAGCGADSGGRNREQVPGSLQNGSHWAFSFDMSSLSSSQEVSLAQLRVRLPRAHNVSLDIYHSQRRRCRGDGTCAHQLFLGTVAGSPSATQASWKVFEVTNLLRSWLHQAVLPGHPSATGRAQWDESGSIAPVTTGHGDAADRVLLLVFSKDKSPGDHSLIRTAETSKYIMRDSGSQGAGTRRQRRNRMEKQRIKASEAAAAVPREQGQELCRRVDMVVDFEQTGWGSWIVYPKKYNAYRCEGLCPSPVDETFKPTNHAYIQSLLRLYKPNLVPCPACSPVKMSPLSMLYYERGEVVVRHHEDMIIEECGCN
ncbi:Nodal like protein [Turdus rufiventris]|nr:Nodal like protein [Turdus rufiventris]